MWCVDVVAGWGVWVVEAGVSWSLLVSLWTPHPIPLDPSPLVCDCGHRELDSPRPRNMLEAFEKHTVSTTLAVWVSFLSVP